MFLGLTYFRKRLNQYRFPNEKGESQSYALTTLLMQVTPLVASDYSKVISIFLGRANLQATSIPLIIPVGTGQAACLQCLLSTSNTCEFPTFAKHS